MDFFMYCFVEIFFKKILLNQISVLIAPDASIPNSRASYSEYVSLISCSY